MMKMAYQDGIAQMSDSIKIIRTNPGIGFGRACNVGLQAAIEDGCDLLVIVNQDSYIGKETLRLFEEFMISQDGHVICIPMVYEYESDRLEYFMSRYVLAHTSAFADLYNGELKSVYDVRKATAACMCVSAATLKEIGCFDPLFHMYGEDDDLFFRLQRAGGQLKLLTRASLYHYHSGFSAEGTARSQIKTWKFYSTDILKARYQSRNLLHYLVSSMWELTSLLFAGQLRKGRHILMAKFRNTFSWWRIRKFDGTSVNKRAAKSISHDLIN